MAALIPFVFMGLIAFGIGVALYIHHRNEKARTEGLSQTAQTMGLIFNAQSDGSIESRLGGMSLFNMGHSKKLFNCISGETDEVRISIFDYQYTVGSGKNQSTKVFSVAALESPRLAMPAFTMRPETFFDKVGSMLGFQDIDFDDHQPFSESFVLKGPDEAAIRAFFQKPLLDFFAQRTGVLVEGEEGRMIFYRSGKCKPDLIEELLSEAYGVFGVIADRQAVNRGETDATI